MNNLDIKLYPLPIETLIELEAEALEEFRACVEALRQHLVKMMEVCYG